MKRGIWISVVVLALVVVSGGLWLWFKSGPSTSAFTTAPVKKGDVAAMISATGTIEPEEVVDVGAQVAGQIISFGKDAQGKSVDYGSTVEAGMVLAQIDDSLYTADAATAAAQLQQAQATLATATANLELYRAKFRQAERDWQRAQKIGPSDALAQSVYDGYQSAFESAQAQVAVGEAAGGQARGAIAQAEAAMMRAKRNLGYCVIKSPVKGVIIDRRVNIGQTVVASLNAPSLFLIAKDLTRIQVWIAVNEADIGNIKPGQPVTFTVDAFPNRVFNGEVGKVRLNATMTQNVVTYTVEVVADNSDGKLLPYLTANAKFLVDKHEGVLTVPNSALRWTPLPTQISPGAREATASGGRRRGGKAAEGGGKPSEGGGESVAATSGRGTLWVVDGAYVKPLRVRTGLSDGTVTEVMGKDLAENTEVVIAVARTERSGGGMGAGGSGSNDTVNPFIPKMPFRPK